MKFTAVLALAMASFAVAAPTDFSASDIEARTNTPSTPPPSGGDSVCSDNRKQVNVQETQGVLGLISIVGTILNQNGGGAYCCDASAPQVCLTSTRIISVASETLTQISFVSSVLSTSTLSTASRFCKQNSESTANVAVWKATYWCWNIRSLLLH